MSEQPDDEPEKRGSRADSTGEFFCIGTPLHAVKAGYIRRRADTLLFDAAVAGRYAHVIAPDRSGKSSLISSTAARLENNGLRVAVLSLNQIGERDAGQDAGRWYYSVAYRLLRQLRIRFDLQTWWQDKSMLSNRQRLQELYAEVLLENLAEQIVVFVDDVQCIGELPFGDQLLASFRSAHNARATDPDFNRLTFILLAECDPLVLIDEADASPFNITQAVPLNDFTREDIDIFATELNLPAEDAALALDRIYYWTRGQPYLTQKLGRAVARDVGPGFINEQVDRIVAQQLTGRAALHSEPHMSQIHRQLVAPGKSRDRLLNLYGRVRKGINVAADLGSDLQRRLLAVGLLEVDDAGELRVRNRIYDAVFTARWANENLRNDWRAPLLVAVLVLVILAIPFGYSQWLPKPYARALTSAASTLPVAESAWQNLRSFPGHGGKADRLYRLFLQDAAARSDDKETIASIAEMASELPNAGFLPEQMQAEFWDRRARTASAAELRDSALLASLEALVFTSPSRRNRAAALIGKDYPDLLATIVPVGHDALVFEPSNKVLTATDGPRFSQWLLAADGITRRDDWLITALDVTPLVRRVIVDQQGTAKRIGLTLNISHPRLADLRVRLTAPSGRTVEIELDRERASSSEDIRIPSAQLRALLDESLAGTWSLSLRDEATGVAGHLVGWNLTLNSQGLVEGFQRGIGIPDPLERETGQYWLSNDGRYAVARASQSDSVRVWDLAYGQPVVAIAVPINEKLIGISAGSRQLVTATLETVNTWDMSSGKRTGSLPVGIASAAATLTDDQQHLFVKQLGDNESYFELWSLEDGERKGNLTVAGATGLVALDASGQRIAIADYDQSVRVWDFATEELLAQISLPLQPSKLKLNKGGQVLAAIFGADGVSVWNIDQPQTPLLEGFGDGDWRFQFSPSGARFAAGHSRIGFSIHDAIDGRRVGPALGAGDAAAVESGNRVLQFSTTEDVLVTNGPQQGIRFWRTPDTSGSTNSDRGHTIWAPAGDAVVTALPDGNTFAIADRSGHVHFAAVDGSATDSSDADISFLGHSSFVRALSASRDGGLLASVGDDNTVRIWETADGLPRSFIASFPGSPIDRLEFSPAGDYLGLLAGSRAIILDTTSGAIVADLELGERHTGMAFAGDDALYVGSDSGALSVIKGAAGSNWVMQDVWQGGMPIRRLEASPNGRFLILVDDEQRAVQFDVSAQTVGKFNMQLPSTIEDIVFSPSGSRVLFRTARWVHRVGSSASGLIWLDAMFVPNALNGSRLLVGAGPNPSSSDATEFLLPVLRDGEPYLQRFSFADTTGSGLFGSRDELVNYWTSRLTHVDKADSFLD